MPLLWGLYCTLAFLVEEFLEAVGGEEKLGMGDGRARKLRFIAICNKNLVDNCKE